MKKTEASLVMTALAHAREARVKAAAGERSRLDAARAARPVHAETSLNQSR